MSYPTPKSDHTAQASHPDTQPSANTTTDTKTIPLPPQQKEESGSTRVIVFDANATTRVLPNAPIRPKMGALLDLSEWRSPLNE
jgi:hypothetical protein